MEMPSLLTIALLVTAVFIGAAGSYVAIGVRILWTPCTKHIFRGVQHTWKIKLNTLAFTAAFSFTSMILGFRFSHIENLRRKFS